LVHDFVWVLGNAKRVHK